MEQLSITPMVSIRPDRISFTTFVRRIRLFELLAPAPAGGTSASNAGEARNASQSVLPKLVKKFHNFEISKNSQRNLKDKISAFNWNVIEIDGHNIRQIYSAIEEAKKSDRPTAIIANTIKGKGVSFMENNAGWHGKAPSKEDYEKALQELK